ncbi:transforming growth factor-beta-induced protein ig-h3 [Trichonephila clavipes]|nr:transforming growth factor-beta-induced protein ig-h3 [Trichonephila clavipes]
MILSSSTLSDWRVTCDLRLFGSFYIVGQLFGCLFFYLKITLLPLSHLKRTSAYTLFIPSNEAVSRLPSNLVDHWRENNPDFTMALLNHVIQDVISLDQLKQGGRLTSRANGATIFVNNYSNQVSIDLDISL